MSVSDQRRADAVIEPADLVDALERRGMAEQFALATLVAGGPAPSVEAILHALLPPVSSTTPTPTGGADHQHAAGAAPSAPRVVAAPVLFALIARGPVSWR